MSDGARERIEALEAHYDRAAAAGGAPGATPPSMVHMKHAHGALKEALIRERCASRRVLDLACGRGGDLHRWHRAGVREVLGVDLSEGSVREARRRAAARGYTHAAFASCKCVGDRADLVLCAPVDVVTCMMAVHYFFDTPSRGAEAMRFVRRHLRLGGWFVGVVPDGDRTRAFLEERGGSFQCDASGVSVSCERVGAARCRVGLRGTVLDESREEPMMFEAHFREAAEAANLHVRRYDRPPPALPGTFVACFQCLAV